MAKSSRRKPLVAEKRYGNRTSSAKTSARSGTAGAKARKKTTTKSKKTRKSTRKRGGGSGRIRSVLFAPFRFVFRIVWALTWRLGLIVGLIVGGAVFLRYTTLPELPEMLDGRARGSVTMMDRNGEVFAWRGDQFGGVVTTDTVSPHLKNAVVATEDKRFYRHFGISPRGVASAVRINMSEGRGPLEGHGGSTITQQTAKLLCLGVIYDPEVWKNEAEYIRDCRRTTMWRKVTEAIYAMAMEVKYSKDEILSIYLNRAYMGGGAYGAEAASQRYFGKSSSKLSPAESAMIAGLLTAPSALAPTNNLKRSQDRAATILRLMNEQRYLDAEQTAYWQANPATLSAAAKAKAGGYFADWIMDVAPDYFSSNTTEDVVIRTTLDPRIQAAAEEAIAFVFQEKVRDGSKAQAAIVVMDAEGAVRAMVGGRDTRVSGVFNRATHAKRQTGSAFKPFVYAAALDLGFSPLATVMDEPFCMNVPGSGQWCPKNYTNKYYGKVTLAHALRDSLNVPAVKVSERAGRDNVRKVASVFGIDSDLALGPALALGASESTLIEMTGAYAGILNGGSSVTPYGLVELTLQGDDEPIIDSVGGIGERVIQTPAAEQLIWMMEQVVSQGTGQRAKVPGWQVAGKTGTTQEARDAWFIGFTADYVAGVWMGYDDNSPLTGVTGGGLPAEIWKEAIIRITEGMTPRPLPMRAPVQPKPQPKPKKERPRGGIGRAVDDVLRDIFGGKR
ncbi:MAG: transglycosylase domain-containing protein [Paracoccaceae bacterium]